jgi:hypothetical protein
MSNILSVIGLFVKGTSRDILDAGEERLESMKNLLIVTFVAPVALLVIGVTIASCSDTVAGVNTGRGFITVAGFLTALLCGVLLIRARIYAYIFLGCTKAAKVALNFMPTLETEEVRKYVSYFFGLMAWIAGVCLYAQIVPVWRSVGTSLVVATAMLCLAAMMAAQWFGGKTAQRTLLVLTLGTLLISTVRLASPRMLNAMDYATDYTLGTDGRTDADKVLLRKYNDQLTAIRSDAATKCGGKYCNDGDVATVKELESNIHLLETGQYWSTMEANSAPATTSAKPVPTTVKTDAAPAKPIKASSPQTDSKPQTRPASKVAATPKESDPFAALDQFPDVPPSK